MIDKQSSYVIMLVRLHCNVLHDIPQRNKTLSRFFDHYSYI